MLPRCKEICIKKRVKLVFDQSIIVSSGFVSSICYVKHPVSFAIPDHIHIYLLGNYIAKFDFFEQPIY